MKELHLSKLKHKTSSKLKIGRIKGKNQRRTLLNHLQEIVAQIALRHQNLIHHQFQHQISIILNKT